MDNFTVDRLGHALRQRASLDDNMDQKRFNAAVMGWIDEVSVFLVQAMDVLHRHDGLALILTHGHTDSKMFIQALTQQCRDALPGPHGRDTPAKAVESCPQIADRKTSDSDTVYGRLAKELAAAVNRVSAENGSNTPDFILGEFLAGCLRAFDLAVISREKWYHRVLTSCSVSDGPQVAGRPSSPPVTPLDAVPAPKADCSGMSRPVGTSDEQLWGVQFWGGDFHSEVYATREQAIRGLFDGEPPESYTAKVVQLCPKLVLTDAERNDLRLWVVECRSRAFQAHQAWDPDLLGSWAERAERVDSLLKRLGGNL